MSTKQIEALKLALEALRVARESVSEWSSYASDYFKDKYDLDGDFEAIDASIEVIEAVLAEQGCDYCNHPQYAGIKCKNCGREQPAQHRHISYVCPQCYWSLEEQPAPAPKVREQQEPVGHGGRPMTLRECMEAEEPAGKPWTGLTDEQIDRAIAELGLNYLADAANNRAVLRELCRKAAHGIKGDA